ncbi:hypothetical protein NQ318_020823 [Aromia moschata]|uniref:Peptidase S1 domain-containing protein n=1 Tax=Aromia moschata TaxID=1265417 RepID=A0AAV8Y5K9_9CUCU|nr:hypothetical protein NQ318_020823 [Aromia moschata]
MMPYFKILMLLSLCHYLGAATSALDERIIGGINATIIDYPYALQIEYYELVCGGVLVASNWALTAGHCLNDRDTEVFIIRVGTTDRGSGGETFEIAEIVYHPQYNWEHDDYDAVLLRLNATVSSPYAQIIEMVPQGSLLPQGENITVVGWGWINEDYHDPDDDNFPDTLQQLDLPILDDETCNATLSEYGIYTDRMFCAGYLKGGKGFCNADNGGPVLYKGLLIGIASWTDNCARALRPGVFTKISSIRSWIDNVIF